MSQISFFCLGLDFFRLEIKPRALSMIDKQSTIEAGSEAHIGF